MRTPWLIAALLLALGIGCAERDGAKADAAEGPQRIVVISPAIAEILDRLGLADRIVGIGQFGPWPPAIEELPVVGGYDSPNVEQVIRLGADALLSVRSQAAAPAHRRLHQVGIEVMALDTSTFAGVFNALQLIGERFARQAAAQQLADRVQRELDAVAAQSQHLARRRVLFVVGRDPVYVAGPGSHIDHLLRLAGGENIAADLTAPYQQMSLETILERQPEVIVDTSFNHSDALRGRQAGPWGQWAFLPAVRHNRIYWVDPSQMVIPGIRLADMARLLGKFIHPETFGEPAASDYQPYRGAGDAT